MKIIYNYCFIPFAKLAIKVLQRFNPKIKSREEQCELLMSEFEKHPRVSTGRRYWFHAASMGEFEQAKPIIEAIKQTEFNSFVFVTFYSPSGYENQKDYPYADAMAYMPIDSRANAKRIIDIIHPDIAIFIRYEIWYNHLTELKKRQIQTILVNASEPNSKVLNLYYKKAFKLFDKIFVMNAQERHYFTDIVQHKYVKILPDTRFDRIWERVKANVDNPLFDRGIFNSKLVLVAGSTWTPDDEIVIEAVDLFNKQNEKKIILVLVPHEPTAEHIVHLTAKCDNYILLSQYELAPEKYNSEIIKNNPMIIVDSIGKLLRIYANADIAYVGGAFGVGIHSVTEPAGYGLPIITGPNMTNSPDAVELKELALLQIVNNSSELLEYLNRLNTDSGLYKNINQQISEYVLYRTGSTKKFLVELYVSAYL